MASKYETVTEATVSWDEPTDAWRLEIWDGESGTALAMWPVHDAKDLDADAYAAVKILLEKVGVYDQGRASWSEKNGQWSAEVLPRPFAE
jgi:hypothetical protein